jgi:hypothetical protein
VLNDRERATLHEIQSQFLAEDPRFVQTFDVRTQRLSTAVDKPIDRHGWAPTILIWTTAVLGIVALMTGSVGGAMLLATVGVALLLARR